MNFLLGLGVFSVLIAVFYLVLFSKFYPLVEIHSGIVTLCAFAAVATCLIAVGSWTVISFVWKRIRPAPKADQ